MELPFIGKTILDDKSTANSIGHYSKNKKTTLEHKQIVTASFTLVPDVLKKGMLVEYGRQINNNRLYSYSIIAPISLITKKGSTKYIMAVRVRKHSGQEGRFYLHSVEMLEDIKKKSRVESLVSGGLAPNLTRTPQRDKNNVPNNSPDVNNYNSKNTFLSASNSFVLSNIDVFRIVKKAFSIDDKDALNSKWNFSYHNKTGVDAQEYLERARVESVRNYWEIVTKKIREETGNIRKLFYDLTGDDLRRKVARAKATLRISIDALPDKYKGNFNTYYKAIDIFLEYASDGKSKTGVVITKDDLRIFRSLLKGLTAEEADSLVGQKIEDIVEKVFSRCSSLIDRYARDQIIAEISTLCKATTPTIDDGTKKYKISKYSANAIRFMRGIILPAVWSTDQEATIKLHDLTVEITELNKEYEEYSKTGAEYRSKEAEEYMSDLYNQIKTKQQEYLIWDSYSALGSSDIHRAVNALKYVSTWMEIQSEGRLAQLRERRDEIIRQATKLQSQLKERYTNDSFIAASDASKKDKKKLTFTGESIANWVSSPIQVFDNITNKIGGHTIINKLKKEYLINQNLVQSAERARQNEWSVFQRELFKNKKEEHTFQKNWMTNSLSIKTDPIGVEIVKISIEKAGEILAEHDKNPVFGSVVYSAEMIEKMRRAYAEWLSGDSKVRKWLKVEQIKPFPKNTYTLNKDQALKVLMTCEQNSYDDMMSRKGFTMEVREQLQKFIGEKGMKIKDYLFAQYEKSGKSVAPLYESRYGVPFPTGKKYAPGCFIALDKIKDNELGQLLGQEEGIMTARSDGFLSVRELHYRDLDLRGGALVTYWQHMAKVDNWCYTQEWVERAKMILSDRETTNKLYVNIGEKNWLLLKGIIANVENGGVVRANNFEDHANFLNDVMKNKAQGLLGGKISVVIKQASAILNGLYGCELTMYQWLQGMWRVINNKAVMSPAQLRQTELFKNRLGDGQNFDKIAGEYEGHDWLDSFIGKSMGLLGAFDGLNNSISFAACFDHYYNEAIDLGLSHEMALSYAGNIVQDGIARASQPTNWTETSNVKNSEKSLGKTLLFMLGEFLNKSALSLNYLRQGKWRMAVRTHLLFGMSSQIMGYLVDNFFRDDEDKKELNPLNYIPGIIFGALNGVPIIGDVMGDYINAAWKNIGLPGNVRVGSSGRLFLDKRDFKLLVNNWEDRDSAIDRTKATVRGTSLLGATISATSVIIMSRKNVFIRGPLAVAIMSNYLATLVDLADTLDIQDAEEDKEERLAPQRKRKKELHRTRRED